MPLVECVPNFSEGRRPEVVAAIRDAIAGVVGATVLDVSMDASHNRSVITFVASPERAVDAAFEGVRAAHRLIDLAAHEGCHPRLGAADVVPFVPLEGVTMAECVALAHELGRRVGDELEVPVYLYEHAATRPERRNLADVRRGGLEGLRELVGTDPERAPDYGPHRLHPTAGAVAVGARDLLVAFNVHLGPASNLPVARAVARAVRGSSGGLRGVKALALEVDGQAQVSMNLVDVDGTPVHQAFELVRLEAEARGVAVTWSEIVGLAPERAILAAGARHLRLPRYTAERLLEHRLRAERGGVGGEAWQATLAAPTPAPGGGAAAAMGGALAAALAAMVAGLATRAAARARARGAAPAERADDAAGVADRAERLRRELLRLAEADALVYGGVTAAQRLPRDDEAAAARRRTAVAGALLEATLVPRDAARAAADAAELALDALRLGPRPAATDAYAGVALAEAAAAAAHATVRSNVGVLERFADVVPDDQRAALLAESAAHARRAERARAAATAAVDEIIGRPASGA